MITSIPSATLENFTTFGDLLRFLRRRAGLTQAELALAVGYGHTQISRLEQNLRLPDIPTIEARFVPALALEAEPKAAARLVDLAAQIRREDAPALGLCPYKGLNYFDEADADLFVGRETLTAKLLERVLALNANSPPNTARFLAIVGASGSGKSSLVRAGLVPALRWSEASADWQIHIFTPTAHPLESLALTLTAENGPVSAVATLMDDFAREPRSLQIFVKRKLALENGSRLLLVIDQFEELFALCRSEEERTAFIDNLLIAASEGEGRVILLITLRADFYAHCANYPRLREVLAHQQEYIGALSNEELRRVIEEPAQRGRWEFEPGLVDVLLHDVGQEPGALPLLSHALFETWQRRRSRTMTLSGYASSGGVRGAIAETAETVFTDQFTHEQQAIARRIFLRLTELNDETSAADTRRRATFKELILKPEEAATTHAVLKALADARLITTSQDSAEVAHEALIREWPTLRSWLEDNRESLRFHRHLTDAAQEWQALNREPDLLYRGARLAQAREWGLSHPDELNVLEQDFLQSSIAQGEREVAEREEQYQRELEAARKLIEVQTQRAAEQAQSAHHLRLRDRVIMSVALLALVLVVLTGEFRSRSNENAMAAETNRRTAFARELAAASVANLNVDPELSILLALQGVEATAPDQTTLPEVENALHRAIGHSRIQETLVAHQGQVWGMAYSPDGTRLATSGSDGKVRIWDAVSDENLLTLQAQDADLTSLVFSPDGKQLAAASNDGSAKIWEAATGQLLLELRGHTKPVHGIAFRPDGKQLATESLDGSIKFWDAVTGEDLKTWRDVRGSASPLAYSPDGTRILYIDSDQVLRIAAAESEAEIYQAALDDPVFALSPNGQRLAFTPAGSGSIRVVDASNQNLLYNIPRPSNVITWMEFSPDNSLLAITGLDRQVQVFDAANGEALFVLAGHSDSVNVLAFNPNGKQLASGAFDGTVKIWSLERPSEVSLEKRRGINRLALSPDGTWIAAASAEPGTFNFDLLTVWDAQNGKILFERKAHQPEVGTVAVSPDGKEVATGGSDRTIKLWNVPSGTLRLSIPVEDDFIWSIAYPPDGKSVAAVGLTGMIRFYDRKTGKVLASWDAGLGELSAVAFSPDGSKLAVVSNQASDAKVWDVATRKELLVLKGHTDINWGVEFSPDGTRVITSGSDGTARVWDTATGTLLLTLSGHTSTVVKARFSPDGKWIATAGKDGTTRLWEAANGKELLSLESVSTNDVAFISAGKRLVIGDAVNIQVVALTIDELVQIARSRLTRSLTIEECQKYLHLEQCPSEP
jgi:WD40 repeat protein/transcriptional regulator with XRE-family HTH domain